jgi:hypothetical protein
MICLDNVWNSKYFILCLLLYPIHPSLAKSTSPNATLINFNVNKRPTRLERNVGKYAGRGQSVGAQGSCGGKQAIVEFVPKKSLATQENEKFSAPSNPPLQLFHQHSCYIVSLLLAVVLLSLPSSPVSCKVLLFASCWYGSSALMECIVPFTAHIVPLPTPEKLRGRWLCTNHLN